jgi:glycosyltransferase involved in cell wall biosynthesis
MRIGLVAPPFLPVPPKRYGGTELFIANLALGLQRLGHEVIVYSNGESTVDAPVRWFYEEAQWPIQGEIHDNLKDLNHTSWACADAALHCDVVHLNNAPGLVSSRFVNLPFVYTIHHPYDDGLSSFYGNFPSVEFVTISHFQRKRTKMSGVRTIHHGIDLSHYSFREQKSRYFAFIGRIAPVKGAHLAIEVAKRSGIPLKIAGEVQPRFRNYFERRIKPHLDGKLIEYIGEADLAAKNELLSNAMAMLFPIQWQEPFGLVMIEAMACGTPVIALPGGSVEEIVRPGVSGYICRSVDEMVERARDLDLAPSTVHAYAQKKFSLEQMVQEYAALYQELVSRAHAEPVAGVDVALQPACDEDDSDGSFPLDRAIA